MVGRFFNSFGMNVFQGGSIGFMLNRLKSQFIRDGKSAESAEFAVSVFCYSLSVMQSKNADNATLMLMLDMLLPDILGKSATTNMLKRAISIGLVFLKDSYLTKTPDLLALSVTAGMAACGLVSNQLLEDALPVPRNFRKL